MSSPVSGVAALEVLTSASEPSGRCSHDDHVHPGADVPRHGPGPRDQVFPDRRCQERFDGRGEIVHHNHHVETGGNLHYHPGRYRTGCAGDCAGRCGTGGHPRESGACGQRNFQ